MDVDKLDLSLDGKNEFLNSRLQCPTSDENRKIEVESGIPSINI